MYVQDETKIRVESNNYRSWSLIGQHPVIERNGTRRGVNIIGATEISKNFDSIVNLYSSDEKITSNKIIKFLKDLLDINKDKIVFMIWGNARIHTSKAVEKFIKQNEDTLFILNLPPYSPMLNPQENVWNKLKSYFYEYKARSSIDEIKDFISNHFNHANSNKAETKSLVNARSYYK
ncbi:transposase [Proteiniborus sp. MB09-C3]|uniref:transposase n=1 Tax=Proteiniborus sp. MB09-C3 TaxID=3050072 RepID=UPI0025560FD0|nr:transposase [Proteiniborus sp. MB09-C3]WIV13661.1 transposase [Proteiniborus sp. MB09-C3]